MPNQLRAFLQRYFMLLALVAAYSDDILKPLQIHFLPYIQINGDPNLTEDQKYEVFKETVTAMIWYVQSQVSVGKTDVRFNIDTPVSMVDEWYMDAETTDEARSAFFHFLEQDIFQLTDSAWVSCSENHLPFDLLSNFELGLGFFATHIGVQRPSAIVDLGIWKPSELNAAGFSKLFVPPFFDSLLTERDRKLYDIIDAPAIWTDLSGGQVLVYAPP